MSSTLPGRGCSQGGCRLLPPAAFALAAVAALGAGCGSDSASRAGAPEPSPDGTCLQFLLEREIPYEQAPPTQGVRTPVLLRGSVRGIRLQPRVGRPPLMDCELLRALWESAPVFARAGVEELSFSGAYVYRTRHRSSQLSAHAFGLALDVHVLRGRFGELDIKRDFEKGRGAWRSLVTREGDIDNCIGSPRTSKGRRLRRLACELKHHSAFRVIITPDDDADHRDHLHIEAFSDAETRVARVMGGFR